MRLGGPQGLSGRVRNISPAPEFDSRTVQPVAHRYTGYVYVYNETGYFVVYIGLIHTLHTKHSSCCIEDYVPACGPNSRYFPHLPLVISN